MAAIRLYLTALTLVFFFAVVMTTGIGVLEATVMTSVPLLLILDMRKSSAQLDRLKSN